MAPDGSVTRSYYDSLGNLTQSVSPVQYATGSDTATFTTENIVSTNPANLGILGYLYAYNTAGRVTQQTDSLGNITSYQYDVYGNLTKETLPNGLAYTYTYDKLNRMKTKNYLNGSTTVKLAEYTYTINTDGTTAMAEKVYFTDSSTATTTTQYNFAGRIIKITNPDAGYSTRTYVSVKSSGHSGIG